MERNILDRSRRQDTLHDCVAVGSRNQQGRDAREHHSPSSAACRSATVRSSGRRGRRRGGGGPGPGRCPGRGPRSRGGRSGLAARNYRSARSERNSANRVEGSFGSVGSVINGLSPSARPRVTPYRAPNRFGVWVPCRSVCDVSFARVADRAARGHCALAVHDAVPWRSNVSLRSLFAITSPWATSCVHALWLLLLTTASHWPL